MLPINQVQGTALIREKTRTAIIFFKFSNNDCPALGPALVLELSAECAGGYSFITPPHQTIGNPIVDFPDTR
jgi:hypothetical protein